MLTRSRESGSGSKRREPPWLYLPPYSPDFHPIENAWSQIKPHLRSAKSRTAERWEQVIPPALRAIPPPNASAWFSHGGYGLQDLLKWSRAV